MTKLLYGWWFYSLLFIQVFGLPWKYIKYISFPWNVRDIFKLETFQNYWEPLKKTENSLIEQNLVGEIFYQVNSAYQRRALVCLTSVRPFQIPFLLNHHTNFLLKLKTRLEACESRATIGDLFLEMVSHITKFVILKI